MRVKTDQVLRAFRSHRPCTPSEKYPSIWTDGQTIFSYSTAIATAYHGHLILNGTDYSVTTSDKQSDIAVWHETGLELFYLDDLPFEVTRDDLIRYALAGTHSKKRLRK